MNRLYRSAIVASLAMLACPVASAADTRAVIAPDAYCRTLSDVPGVTNVQCDAKGRPLVISGRSPSGELYRMELSYGAIGPADHATINGESVNIVPLPDAKSAAERLMNATKRARTQRMELCPSGEVVAEGGACAELKDGQPVVGFCAGNVCYGNSYMLGPQNGYIRNTITQEELDRFDRDNSRMLMMCLLARDAQLSSCASQYSNAHAACVLMGVFGAEAVIACELGMEGMNQYCTSLAPNC